MNTVVRALYQVLPNTLIRYIGSSKVLKPLRDRFLRDNGRSKTVTINAHWQPEDLRFQFRTNIKTSVRAAEKGIESSLLKLSLKLLNYKTDAPDKTILDIGASFGYLSVVWGQTVASQGKVYSFEASAHAFSCLADNVISNNLGKVITPINRPVFSESAKVFVVNSPSSSFIAHGLMPINGEAIFQEESIAIDDFITGSDIKKIDFIKIDVDGVELEILKGGIHTLRKWKPILIVESNNDKRIAEFLQGLGYNLFDMNLKKFNGTMPNNLVCLPG